MDTPESSVREIPKWVRRNAQNNTIPALLGLVVFTVLFVGISGFSYLGGNAYRTGHRGQFLWFLAADLVCVGALVPFCVPRWGGRWILQLSERFCSQEGRVKLGSAKPVRAVRGAAIGFALCILASVIAGILGLISSRFMQPVSALYVVPFATFLILVQRPMSSYLMLMWPALYAVHAILILAGGPTFRGRWDVLNMLIPTAGYGLFSTLIALLYSRYALFRLKRLARERVLTKGDGLA